jgi:hypothetical protein
MLYMNHTSREGEYIMPYGGNDWLALTQEPTLEPEIAICDPHHHFWDFRTARTPYQRYLLHELVADFDCGHNVRSTVFIEARTMYRPAGPVELRPVGEIEFVQGLAAASASGLYGPCRATAAIVGHADLKLADRVEPVLQALQAASPNRFRGIRHTVTWDPHPEVENREKEGVLASTEYRAGARVLARMGLCGGWPVVCRKARAKWLGESLQARASSASGTASSRCERIISAHPTAERQKRQQIEGKALVRPICQRFCYLWRSALSPPLRSGLRHHAKLGPSPDG